ncbi:hypothetical protein MMC17_008665 [Xylographa soralifera]|nr:hypothetical protein [Xylographa soralifera]
MLRALFILTLLSTILPFSHPADTDDDSDPLTRNLFMEFHVDKSTRLPIPPTHPSNIGTAGTIALTTVRLYLRNNPSPYSITRTDIGIPYITSLWTIGPSHLPHNTVMLAPTLLEVNHQDTPPAVPEGQLGRMLTILNTPSVLATFHLGSTPLTNEQLMNPVTGKGLILDAVAEFKAAGGGGTTVLMQMIVDRIAPRRREGNELWTQRQELFDANMAGYMERVARRRRGDAFLGAGPGAAVGGERGGREVGAKVAGALLGRSGLEWEVREWRDGRKWGGGR